MGIIERIYRIFFPLSPFDEMKQSLTGNAAKKRNESVLARCEGSTDPLDILASGYAYNNMGAAYRPQAIERIEAFLAAPCTLSDNDWWELYTKLAVLYEKEYRFVEAIEMFRKRMRYDSNDPFLTEFNIIDIYVKIDVEQALDYANALKNTDSIYRKYKPQLDAKYKELLQLKAKGYKYHPRKRNTEQ